MCRHHYHACIYLFIFFKGFRQPPSDDSATVQQQARPRTLEPEWQLAEATDHLTAASVALVALWIPLWPPPALDVGLCQRAAVCWRSSRITSQQVPLRMQSSSIWSECLPSILWVSARSLQPQTLNEWREVEAHPYVNTSNCVWKPTFTQQIRTNNSYLKSIVSHLLH